MCNLRIIVQVTVKELDEVKSSAMNLIDYSFMPLFLFLVPYTLDLLCNIYCLQIVLQWYRGFLTSCVFLCFVEKLSS